MLAETPEIMYVLRRYLWLLVLGTLVGLLVGVVSYYVCRKWFPKYTVFAQFQVMPLSSRDPLSMDREGATVSSEEILRLINRQKLLVQNEAVLNKALSLDAFKTDFRDPTSKRRSGWLESNSESPLVALKKQIEVVPVFGSDVFRIQMTGSDGAELARLVNAVSDTYYEELRAGENQVNNARKDELNTMKKKLEEKIRDLESSLAEFRTTHDISAITRAYEVNAQTLGLLNAELIKAEAENSGARSQYETIKKQVEANTLQLSGAMENFVENDPNLRYLENQKLGLQQELEVALTQFDANHRSVRGIETRIAAVNKQADDIRQKLRSQARLRMQEEAQNTMIAMAAREQDLKERRDRKDRELKDLDRWLVDYQTKKATLDEQREVFKRVNEQATLTDLKQKNDAERVRKFSPAVAPEPTEMSSPKFWVFVPGGFLGGLVLSFGLAYLLELTNTRVRSPRDITKTMQLPLLGFIPDQDDDSFAEGEIATTIRTSPGSMIAESFRQIRSRLAAQAHGKPISTMLVASASPGGGATTIASNLANAMALNDLRVLLVDANFYRPGLANCYKNIPSKGLGDLLSGSAKIEDVIVSSSDLATLHLMGAGTKPPISGAELLETKNFGEMLSQLKGKFDVVIFDGAPLNLVSDSLTLAGKVDGVVTVVRAGMISRGTVARVRDQLKAVHANLLGIVLNAAQTHGAGYFKENYRSFYEYAGPQKRTVVAASRASAN